MAQAVQPWHSVRGVSPRRRYRAPSPCFNARTDDVRSPDDVGLHDHICWLRYICCRDVDDCVTSTDGFDEGIEGTDILTVD